MIPIRFYFKFIGLRFGKIIHSHMSAIKLTINKIVHFIEVDIWRMRLAGLPKFMGSFLRIIRIILLAIKGFNRDDCATQASALTFLSSLSIVPVLAMAFGVSKGFGLEKTLQEKVLENFVGHEEIMTQAFGVAQKMLDSTKGGLIAGIGLVILLYAVMKLLHNIEVTLDKIWEIKKHRSFVRKLTDYLAIILIGPILVILSSSATVFISTEIVYLSEQVSLLGAVQPLILFGIKLIPYSLIWLLFTLTYIIMPNTHVSLKSGIIAGIIAGTVYQLVQWGYINFQVGVSRYNAIYGSFAAVPLFLIWMQLSWLIVLLGAEISFAHQNVDRYQFDDDNLKMSPKQKKIIALLVVRKVVQYFESGDPPKNIDDIAKDIGVPVRFVEIIMNELLEAEVLSEVVSIEGTPRYQPALDIHKIDVQLVVDRLENRGLNNVCGTDSEDLKKINESLDALDHEITNSKSNKLLYKI